MTSIHLRSTAITLKSLLHLRPNDITFRPCTACSSSGCLSFRVTGRGGTKSSATHATARPKIKFIVNQSKPILVLVSIKPFICQSFKQNCFSCEIECFKVSHDSKEGSTKNAWQLQTNFNITGLCCLLKITQMSGMSTWITTLLWLFCYILKRRLIPWTMRYFKKIHGIWLTKTSCVLCFLNCKD